ncbi:MAG: SRPBCC family protein [Gammaproteobacteria bacterium]|nr:SRPBCC family protein [Gammaproteobacteria bacterium]
MLNFSSNAEAEEEIIIEKKIDEVFEFVAVNFLTKYPKWSPEIKEIHALSDGPVITGYQFKQIREENEETIETIMTVAQFIPKTHFSYQSITEPIAGYYYFEKNNDDTTKLTFKFKLNDIELSMRPFAKLIKAAISEGVNQSLKNIKCLMETNNQVLPTQ